MTRPTATLITGAAGEIGHGLIARLAGSAAIVTLDLAPLPAAVAGRVTRQVVGSVLDPAGYAGVAAEFAIDRVFHLAALLSTKSEADPVLAHRVNVDGTLAVLEFARTQADAAGRPVPVFYPSSIAVYGLPDRATKLAAGRVTEDQYQTPATVYGVNKLTCEHLGRYYAGHYRQRPGPGPVDFRALRYPGLISADTVPSGGTSDFAPELVHAAARGDPYTLYCRPDTALPLMAMPDAVEAALKLMAAPRDRLTRTAYNAGSFAATAGGVLAAVRAAYPAAAVAVQVDPVRQAILDSWPAAVDDAAARADWGHSPRYDFAGTLAEYLLPAVGRRYA